MKKRLQIMLLLIFAIQWAAGCFQTAAPVNPVEKAKAQKETVPVVEKETPAGPISLDELNRQALYLFGHGQYNEAIVKYQAILDRAPEYPLAHNGMGNCHMQKSHFKMALEHYESAVKLSPDNSLTRLSRGDALVELEKYDRAKKDIAYYLKKNPDHPEGYYSMAQLYQRKKNYKEALKYLNKAIKIKPDEFAYRSLRAVIYMSMGRKKDFEREIESAMKLRPNSPALYSCLAMSYVRREDYDTAISILDQAIKDSSSQGKEGKKIKYAKGSEILFKARSFCYSSKKDYESALADLDKALEINPMYLEAYSGKMHTLYELGRTDEVYDAARQVLQRITTPHNAEQYYHLGMAHTILEHKEEAMAMFNKAIEMDPTNPRAYFERAYIYGRQDKDPDKAKPDLVKVIENEETLPINREYAQRLYKEMENLEAEKRKKSDKEKEKERILKKISDDLKSR